MVLRSLDLTTDYRYSCVLEGRILWATFGLNAAQFARWHSAFEFKGKLVLLVP